MNFLRFLREDWGEFQNGMYVEGARKDFKKIRFYRIYIEISQLGQNVIKIALKWKSNWASTSLTAPLSRFSVRKSNSATRVIVIIIIENLPRITLQYQVINGVVLNKKLQNLINKNKQKYIKKKHALGWKRLKTTKVTSKNRPRLF